MKRLPRLLATLLALVLLGGFARQYLLSAVESEAFNTRPAGVVTPDLLGVRSQQFSFASGDRALRGSYVPAREESAPAVLIFHGDEESISDWAAVQRSLYMEGISSCVFDYSGYGASTGTPSVQNLHQDGLAAYERFLRLTPRSGRRYVFGFSLGTAALLDVVNDLQPPPDGVVLAGVFASAREMAVSTGLASRWLAWLLPDVWNSEDRVGLLKTPLLIIHSRADEVIPYQHAERLDRAATGPHRLILFDGLTHDAPITPGEAEFFWAPIVRYMRSGRMESADAGETGGVALKISVGRTSNALPARATDRHPRRARTTSARPGAGPAYPPVGA
ncbi:MAG: alpha/beta fold hydrolase [Burkholderiales bacterium]